jgi:antitoxin (DNA-binding transcriptional repressor) of toxin-antitoxin stability system
MSVSVGVREFRRDLAEYIDQPDPVAVTRHGHTVALFIPVRRDRRAEVQAYADAARRANTLLTELGMTEDEVVTEYDALRRADR